MLKAAFPKRIERKPSYNEKKTTQAAVLLLKLNGGHMNYMKLVKLLYNIDREAMRQWARPVTFDEFYSLPFGQIVSHTLDKAENSKPLIKTYWDSYIRTDGHENILIEDCGDDELSPAEVSLIEETDKKYKNKDQYALGKEHHNPKLFPEYEDPGSSRIPTDYETVLQKLGFPDTDINEFTNQMEEMSILESLA